MLQTIYFCFKSIQTCCLGMISWWNFPKSNFSICVKKLVCRMNSTMNVFLSMQILYNGRDCRGWRHLHPIFPASWLHHRQMGTASLLKSLGMRGLMKVTGFRYLTERDATLGWLWCSIWWEWIPVGWFSIWICFSHVMPMRHDFHHSPILLHLLDARWYFEIYLNIV